MSVVFIILVMFKLYYGSPRLTLLISCLYLVEFGEKVGEEVCCSRRRFRLCCPAYLPSMHSISSLPDSLNMGSFVRGTMGCCECVLLITPPDGYGCLTRISLAHPCQRPQGGWGSKVGSTDRPFLALWYLCMFSPFHQWDPSSSLW